MMAIDQFAKELDVLFGCKYNSPRNCKRSESCGATLTVQVKPTGKQQSNL